MQKHTLKAELGPNLVRLFFWGGVLIILHAIVIRPLTSHTYKVGTEHAGVSPDQARNQSRSAKRRGVFGESHEALRLFGPKPTYLSCIWMTASNELLYFLVSPLPEKATAYTLPYRCLTI